MRRAIVLACLAAAFVTGTALGGTGYPAPATVTLVLSAGTAEYGGRIVAAGLLEPAVAGEEIVLEHGFGDIWIEIARTTVFASGTFAVEIEATGGGPVRARSVDSGAVSVPVLVSVSPKVEVARGHGIAFVGATISARIWPSTYTGEVAVTVKRDGVQVGEVTARATDGRLRAKIPTPGTGRFSVVLSFPEAPGLAPTFATTRVAATGRALSAGSSGPDVRALQARLAALKLHLPAPSSTFSSELTDSVIAFQKAYRLPRTGIVTPGTWRALASAQVLRPRHRGPTLHIEVDKTRQILMVVRNGQVAAVIPVSSGATGNTPEGKHQIRWKALATTTWLGPAILYRTMTFYGNSFAIHGFPSVPVYPASHGCVRIPIWAADWLYNQSSVGETVYVYR